MATYEKSKVIDLEKSIDYTSGGIISKQVTKNKAGNITIFSFDKNQGLSEHSTNHDAFVQILDGKAEIIMEGKEYHLKAGDCIILPAKIPHTLKATEAFKMLLTMIMGED